MQLTPNNLPTHFDSCLDNIIVHFPKEYFQTNKIGGLFADHDPLVFKYGH